MAVVVQEYIEGSMSGIAFSQDPRQRGTNCQLIEMKRGSCESLSVDTMILELGNK